MEGEAHEWANGRVGVREMVGDMIGAGNIYPFLKACAGFAGYDFDESDWTAVFYGIKKTSVELDERFEYEFSGVHTLKMWLSWEPEGDVIVVRAESDPEIEHKVGAAIQIMQDWTIETDHSLRSAAP